MSSPALFFNGVNGVTGELFPPATLKEIAAIARGATLSSESRADREAFLRQGKKGLREGDPRDLAQAGWGIIFAEADQNAGAVYDALSALRELRRSQAVAESDHYYQEYFGEDGYKAGDTKRRFLSRHGVGSGAADPNDMPYYLLIVGDPESIPWEFQYELDIQYAVGRIWFETVDEYRRYAESVVAAETTTRMRDRSAAVFAPCHEGDDATKLSARELAAPLAERIAKRGWSVTPALEQEATKSRLLDLLAGSQKPDLLFTAGHGLWFPCDHPLQLPHMGSLLCQDWPGSGSITPAHFFGADDVNGMDLSGLLTFLFACYSAGGPAQGDFKLEPVPVASRPFVSRLPRHLLQAGALAVVGHVESAWQCSIDWPGVGRHIKVFEDFVDRLFRGHPVGSAMEPFGVRYAELSSELAGELTKKVLGAQLDDELLAELWTNSHDARNYVVLGDPAVRLIPPEGAL
jgi:hypothetical protein